MKHYAKLLLAAVLLAGTPAVAQPVDDAARAAARQLGKEGLESYKEGHYENALQKLNRAYAVVQAPTLGLWTARAMVELGRWVEAAERYLEVTRLEVTGGDVELQKEAKRVAAEERDALLPRIPQLTVVVQGAAIDQVKVQLDGKDVPPALVGVRQPANPGVRRATGKLGDQVAHAEVELAPGQTGQLALDFSRSAASPASKGTSSVPPPGSPSSAASAHGSAATDAGPRRGSVQRTLGWVGIGLGGTGLAVGGITGVSVLSRQNKLESSNECVNEACGPAEYDNVDKYNRLRPVSTAGFIVGGVGLATGLTLLLAAPPGKEEATAHVSPWVGVGSAGLAGRF